MNIFAAHFLPIIMRRRFENSVGPCDLWPFCQKIGILVTRARYSTEFKVLRASIVELWCERDRQTDGRTEGRTALLRNTASYREGRCSVEIHNSKSFDIVRASRLHLAGVVLQHAVTSRLRINTAVPRVKGQYIYDKSTIITFTKQQRYIICVSDRVGLVTWQKLWPRSDSVSFHQYISNYVCVLHPVLRHSWRNHGPKISGQINFWFSWYLSCAM